VSRRRTGVQIIGRLLQIAGLVLPGLAIVMQITELVSVGKMLVMAVASFAMFYIGRILEGYSRSR
jgi:hypothetical protein